MIRTQKNVIQEAADGGTLSYPHIWFELLKSLLVRKQGHHGDLKGVQSVMVGPVDNPVTGLSKYSSLCGVAEGNGQQDQK